MVSEVLLYMYGCIVAFFILFFWLTDSVLWYRLLCAERAAQTELQVVYHQ